jgi:hypothetical protein
VSDNCVECLAPPFSGVVDSGRWGGVNVGSRVIRAGFTGTRGVLVSAVPSAGVGNPASCFGVRGSVRVVMGLAPAGQIGGRVKIAVGAMPTATGEYAVKQRQIMANSPTLRAELA